MSDRKEVKTRLDPDTFKKFEQEAKDKGLTFNDLGEKAIKHYLTCDHAEVLGSMRLIVLKYPALCIKCGRRIEAGEWALWGRGVGAICMDCYVTRIGDKAMVKKFMKVRELKFLVKSLQSEADRLGEKFATYNAYEKIEAIHQMNSDLHKVVMEYLRQSLGTSKEQEALDQVIQTSRRIFETLKDLTTLLQSPVVKKKKKERKVSS